VWALVVFMLVGTGDPSHVVPRSVIVAYGIVAAVMISASRWAGAWLLRGAAAPNLPHDLRPVVIYGAGASGIELLEALRRSGGYDPVGFIDHAPSLIGQRISGLKVYRVEKLPRLVERDGIREVLLALPSHRRRERQEIIRNLSKYPVPVKILPSIEDIASGRVAVTDLRPVDVLDLLGRDPVPPDGELLGRAVGMRSVMVTGAGGSIGSELVRQILRQQPRRLVLYEISETALYDIETEIADALERRARTEADRTQAPKIVSVLGSVLDETLLDRTIRQHEVETIYHAAAYKHVPIVESNPVIGLRNNTLGTSALASVASRLGVARVTLISTDKAVRPTSIMGASKRLAELIFQAHAADTDGSTVFTMVRFGNVLDSSGSVVRRFRKQIENGGPVTVTDRHVTRYFMSIPEAASLVIQASAMAQGGEVFVLDMGEPVRIDDLARTMIKRMGREVRDETNPDGDIEIEYMGLRPGEKLYEELRLEERTTPTEHPRIRRHSEPYLEKIELAKELSLLEEAMASGNLDVIQAVLSRTVEGYRPGPQAPEAEAKRPWPAVSRTLH